MKSISISRTQLVRLLAVLVLATGALTLPTGSVQGAGAITVTNDSDSGPGSLRQAISDAGDGYTVNFDNDYTILLESELTIDKNLTIDGEKSNIVVSGKNAVRVFFVSDKITFNLAHLTVTEGLVDSGGGLYNKSGTVTITDSTFSGNNAKNNGGGLYNHGGSLTITNSTFSGNTAGMDGGGVYNAGILTVTNSTFSGNEAGNAGGGIRNDGGEAALGNTILANSPSGGNCSGGTITDNGGNLVWGDSTCPGAEADPLLSALGSYGGPTQTFALLPGSAAIDAGDDDICAADPVNDLDQRSVTRPQGPYCDMGAFESGGFSLTVSSGSGQSAPANTAFTNPLVVSLSPVSAGEPVDGGTVTFTPPVSDASAVITGSPAAISGAHAQVTATANGILGSYNVNANTNGAASGVNFALENTCAAAITVTSSNDSGAGSLRQAIADICPGGTISFAGDTTIYLASTLTIDKNMTIDGAGHTVAVSGDTGGDGSGNVRVIYVNSSVTFDLKNITVTKGTSTTFGGGILNYGTTTILNSTFSGNSAASNGGAINNQAGPLNVINSTFSGNSATGNGGAINNQAGNLIVTNSTISGNSATHGGGISVINGSLELRNTIVANNPSGGNCWGGITDGGSNLVWGDSTCPGINADPRLSALGSYGGPTQTFALLPGSAAINAADDDICLLPVFAYGPGWLDQRGAARPHLGGCDMGAFESLGFTLSISGGNYQSATVHTAFSAPLQVSISPVSAGEPVNGGTVAFTPPVSDASALITGSPAAISGGHAQVTATANAVFGSYNVNASTSGASSAVDFALENTCVASSLTVTNSNDSGAGSLRQAMADLCPGGTITFAGDTTIHLASQLVIDKNLTIDGSSHSVTVSGDTDNNFSANVPVFRINLGIVNLTNLTITRGKVGIHNAGILTISNCNIEDNDGSGAAAGLDNIMGSVTIANTIFARNLGNGIRNESGSVTITNSTFMDNHANMGGGIFNFGTLTISNSTFTRNNGEIIGGGINNFVSSSIITITNSTFSENNSISGGGIYNAGTVTLRNTIFAKGYGTNCYGTITDGGGNLVWGDTSCPGINADPKLSALGNYGGSTQTFQLLPGSPAINAALDANCPATDQRGVTRPQGLHCDIGAYEFDGPQLTYVRDDYDGDGKSDPVKFQPDTGAAWWLKSSTGLWDGMWMGGDTFQYVSGSDFDGDGKTDPAKFYPAAGTVWWVNSSTGLMGGQWLGPDLFQYVTGSDFDGDGKADPAKFYPETGTVWWVKSTTGLLDGQWLGPDLFQYISGSDFDGDGRSDPAKFYPATGTVWWIRSSDGLMGGMWLGPDTFTFVGASDFDADGKTDPAKYYPSTNTVWWVRSSDGVMGGAWMGPGTFTYIAGDDFNGDGKTDPARYDSSTHTLSWLNTSTGIWTNIDMGTGTYTLANGQ